MTIGLSKLLVNCFAQSSVNFNLNVNTASVEASNGDWYKEFLELFAGKVILYKEQ